MNSISRLLILALLALTPLIASAQEEAPSQPAASPTTTSDLAIPVEFLGLRLEPLTTEELEIEVSAWQGEVKSAALEVAEAAITARAAQVGTPEKVTALEALDQMRTKAKGKIDRLNVALDAWEAKGGDTAKARMYVKAVSGAKVDFTDASSATDALRRWTTSKEGGIRWAINLGLFALTMLVAWLASRIVKRLVSAAMDKHQGSSTLLDTFVKKLIGRVVLFIGFLIALSTLGINVSAVLALIGGASFIIAFAMQDTLSNFANGVMLLIYQPFDVDDAVELGGVSGTVEAVTLVNTRIRTFDNKSVLVPNKSVWGQVITNATANDTRRVDMVFGIGYGDDIEKAHEILKKIVASHELVLADPEPTIRLHELADSSVNFICRPWTKTPDYWAVNSEITKKVKLEFDANGISIPYPQSDVHLHQVE
jgi:small conductance mechanosensitive channel